MKRKKRNEFVNIVMPRPLRYAVSYLTTALTLTAVGAVLYEINLAIGKLASMLF